MKPESIGFALVCLLLTLSVISVQIVQPAHATISPVHVKIVDFAFTPSTIRVVIGVNNTVIWSNSGIVDHTVTANGGAFDSGVVAPGQTYTFTFLTAGTYAYHCSIHSSMVATVYVVSQAPSTTASSTSHSTSSSVHSSSTSTSAASNGSGSGIPEFPAQLGFSLLATALIATSYVIARRVSLPRS